MRLRLFEELKAQTFQRDERIDYIRGNICAFILLFISLTIMVLDINRRYVLVEMSGEMRFSIVVEVLMVLIYGMPLLFSASGTLLRSDWGLVVVSIFILSTRIYNLIFWIAERFHWDFLFGLNFLLLPVTVFLLYKLMLWLYLRSMKAEIDDEDE